MATVTKTTVEVTIGQYEYRAEVDGNEVALFRDGVAAGHATWNGGRIEKFPEGLSEDARDALTAAIAGNLGKAWRARSETFGEHVATAGDPALPSGAPKTEDAGNHGQLVDSLIFAVALVVVIVCLAQLGAFDEAAGHKQAGQGFKVLV